MAVFLCDDELNALAGLPHPAICLYLALRQRMDIRTRKVGQHPLISWQAVSELMYQEPRPGPTIRQLSRDQLRRLADLLQRAGLVEMCSNRNAAQLIFLCCKAQPLSLAQNRPAKHPPGLPATPEPNNGEAFIDTPATPKQDTPAKHRREVYTSKQSSSSTESQNDDDDLAQGPKGGESDPVPLEVQPAAALEAPVKSSAEGQGLIFPKSLNPDEITAISAKVGRVQPDRRQSVIDELAGHMAMREIKAPTRYVDFLIERAMLPIWLPDYAGKIRQSREAAARTRAQLEATQRQQAAAAVLPPKSQNGHIKAAELMQLLKGKATA